MSTEIELTYQNALLADAAYVEFNALGFVVGDSWQSNNPEGVDISSD